MYNRPDFCNGLGAHVEPDLSRGFEVRNWFGLWPLPGIHPWPELWAEIACGLKTAGLLQNFDVIHISVKKQIILLVWLS